MSMQHKKVLFEILYWILFVVAGMIAILLLIGCTSRNTVTLDEYMNYYKGWLYEGRTYYPTDILKERKEGGLK